MYNDLIVAKLSSEKIVLSQFSRILVLDDENLRSSTRLLAHLRILRPRLWSGPGDEDKISKMITVANTDESITTLARNKGFETFTGDVKDYNQPFQVLYADYYGVFSLSRKDDLRKLLRQLDLLQSKCIVFASFSLRGQCKNESLDEIQGFFQDCDTPPPMWNVSAFEICMLSNVKMVFVSCVYTRVVHVMHAHGLLRVSRITPKAAWAGISRYGKDGGGGGGSGGRQHELLEETRKRTNLFRVNVVGTNTLTNSVMAVREIDGRVENVDWDRIIQQKDFFFEYLT